MGIVIGIDVGISTTKIVGLRNGRVLSPIRITAADQVTSLYGAFGKYLHDNKIALGDVEQVMLTGVGAGYIDEDLYGIPTQKVDEFVADGLGARFESGLSKAIVVSMGTGTSFVQCDGDDIKHIGGIGIGECLHRHIVQNWFQYPSRRRWLLKVRSQSGHQVRQR